MIKTLAFILTVAAITAVIWPSPIDSVAIATSQVVPLTGKMAPNDRLQASLIQALPNSAIGPEDVAIDQQGCHYTGVESGDILRRCPNQDQWQVLFNTGGRPLGLSFDHQQRLVIADSGRGLLRWEPQLKSTNPLPDGIKTNNTTDMTVNNQAFKATDSTLTVLVDQYQSQPLKLVNDVDIGPDGTLYFSDSSQHWALGQYQLDGLEGRPSGRLFAYQESTNKLTLLADNLWFANGVAVSQDGTSVLVVETYAHRVNRVSLKGSDMGQRESFIKHLPGYPDGIARDDDGSYWLAIYSARHPILERVSAIPMIKNLIAKIPLSWLPRPIQSGFINHYSADGVLLASYQDRGGVVKAYITSVQPAADGIYFGRLHQANIGFLDRRALVADGE